MTGAAESPAAIVGLASEIYDKTLVAGLYHQDPLALSQRPMAKLFAAADRAWRARACNTASFAIAGSQPGPNEEEADDADEHAGPIAS